MAQAGPLDTFDIARRASAVALVVFALVGSAGALADWVTIDPPPFVPPSEVEKTQPFTGVEAGDGWLVIGASATFVVTGIGLWFRSRRKYAWVAFLSAMGGGAIVVADYRGIGDITSSLSQRVDLVGSASPAVGIALAATGMIGGLIAAVAALVATPPSREAGYDSL